MMRRSVASGQRILLRVARIVRRDGLKRAACNDDSLGRKNEALWIVC
jgi:hypothetical protein